jgi:2-keto-3-deoxy-L-rhamnonate aldolase RhmA
MDVDTAAQIAAASLAVGITPMVRVPGYEHHHASRMLDNGAQGVVVPHVETVEQARRISDQCRFPPLGHRSVGGALQQVGFVSMPVGEMAKVVNEQTLVVAMLESPLGIQNCEDIAAVSGIDAHPSPREAQWASPAPSAFHGRWTSPLSCCIGNVAGRLRVAHHR